jgi:hypothetical protein
LSLSDFEIFLDLIVESLRADAKSSGFSSPKAFEIRIRETINALGGFNGILLDYDVHPHVFPDICLDEIGIEVKFSEKDTWRSVANSVFESTRSASVNNIYVVFGKMGGEPDVKWARYEDCVMHVRTSHVPRFELEIGSSDAIFRKFGVSYAEFQQLDQHSKMEYVRTYARSRLKQGERLWWLESSADEDGHSLPIQARLYTSLSLPEKRKLRAEAVLLCPSVVKGGRTKDKYDDVVLYALTYRGVLCHQARDLFSAGSVAGRERGGNYIQRSLIDIQTEMRQAAFELEDALFVEYWGSSCPPSERITKWLELADAACSDWVPSANMFLQSR